jgi:hypothetical protein
MSEDPSIVHFRNPILSRRCDLMGEEVDHHVVKDRCDENEAIHDRQQISSANDKRAGVFDSEIAPNDRENEITQ